MANEPEMSKYSVDPDDLFNRQLEAGASNDLFQHIAAANSVLIQMQDQNAPFSSALVALAEHLIGQEEDYPRERLASMLALAVLRMAQGA